MATLTIKNAPEPLGEPVKNQAALHRRSLIGTHRSPMGLKAAGRR